jgi:class 3 adenylate cyclase
MNVVDVPDTRYARTADDVHIAYKVIGAGPIDLVYVPSWYSRLDVSWEQPLEARFLRSLASFSRLVMVDRRGIGLSDPVPRVAPPPPEVLVDDLRSVMNAVGSREAALFGVFEGGPLCTLYAATHPESTRGLVLYASRARGAWAPDYPWRMTDQQFEAALARAERAVEDGWDEGFFRQWAEETVPTLAHDKGFSPWLRKAFGPPGAFGAAVALARLDHLLDIRAVLPTIQVPTLVVNRVGDRVADVEEGRWLASQIPGARFVELPGVDHPPWAGDQRSVIETISSFLGVNRPPAEVDRVLATVLFTDIVDSTRKAAELGDAVWKDLVADSQKRSTAEIARHSGTFIDSTGDGVFATFDGPARAVRCAQAIGTSLREIGLVIRSGCHTGEVELNGDTVSGIAVHIGARIAALASGGEVLVSSTVKDLVVGSPLRFENAGEHELKGVPDRWRLYRVLP